MKRTLLLTIVALLSVVTFAQKPFSGERSLLTKELRTLNRTKSLERIDFQGNPIAPAQSGSSKAPRKLSVITPPRAMYSIMNSMAETVKVAITQLAP